MYDNRHYMAKACACSNLPGSVYDIRKHF